MLDRIRLAFSCDESWDRMRGDQRARFCERCQKTVYNLSEMTADEAQATLCGPGSPPCVRYARMADGRVRTTDRVFPRVALTAGLAAAAYGAAWLANEASPRPLQIVPDGEVMIADDLSVPEPGDPAPHFLMGEPPASPPEPESTDPLSPDAANGRVLMGAPPPPTR